MVQPAWNIYMPTQPLVAPGSWVPILWASIWWWNGKVSEETRFMCCGKRQHWRSEGCEEQVDAGSLLDTHLGRWQSGSMLMSMTHIATKTTVMPGIWFITCSHFDVQGPCHHRGHVDLSGLCCHWGTSTQTLAAKTHTSTRVMLIWMGYADIWGHGDIWAHAAVRGHVGVCGLATGSELISVTPDITEGHANIQGLCCYLGSFWGACCSQNLADLSGLTALWDGPRLSPNSLRRSLFPVLSDIQVCVIAGMQWAFQLWMSKYEFLQGL